MKVQDIINGVLAGESIARKAGDTIEADEMKEIGETLQNLHYIAYLVAAIREIQTTISVEESFIPSLISHDLQEKFPHFFGGKILPLYRSATISDLEYLLDSQLKEFGYLK